jgi:peptidyl-prolyl cis-trans isomerase D
MANSMRGKKQSKVMWVIMALLMLGLTGFGIGGLSRNSVSSIGTVGDEAIEVTTYARAFQSASARISQQVGRQLTPQELQDFGVQQQVLNAVVGQAALDNETAKRGLSVGDDLVRRNILESQQFQGLDGKFSKDNYTFYLEQQLRISSSEFETLLRKENARSILENAIVGGVSGDTTVPTALMRFAQQERSFEWVALSEEQLGVPIGVPTEEQLLAFYTENSVNYMSALTRNITYVWLNPLDLLDDVAVDEADIQSSYTLQGGRFNKPEQRAVDRLVFSSMADAQTARDRLDANAVSFSELVAERGLSDADVDLGEVERNDLSAAAAELVFNETEPGIVGPVESFLGAALFRINAVIQADSTPFEEARDELRNELAGEAARRLVADRITQIDDLLAGGATLEDLAKETKMTLGAIAYVQGSEEPIAAYDEFRQAADSVNLGDFPEVLDLSDGGVFALRVDSIVEPAPIPLDDVREKLTAEWRVAQVNQALLALAQRLIPGLENGGDLTVMGLELAPMDGVNRTSFLDNLPPSSILEVFKLDMGKVAVVDAGEKVMMLRLTHISEFDPDKEGNEAILARIKGQLDGQIALDMLRYFSDAIQAEAGVKLNTAIINQVNMQVTGF